jgi:hypothetical protein
MKEGDIILQEGTCDSNLGKIKYVILIPQNPQPDQKKLDPITEDAEFEVIQPKAIEWISKE